MKEIYFEGGPVDDELRAAIGYDPLRVYVQTFPDEPERVSLDVAPRPVLNFETRVALYRRLRFADPHAWDMYAKMHPKAYRANWVAQFDGWEDDTPTNGGSGNE